MKEVIIFDLDGTLWDSSKQVEIVWKKIAEEYDIHITEEKIKSIMGLTEEEIIELLFQNDYKKGKEFISKCLRSENDYLKENGANIYQNTIKVIKDLYDSYELYIVSNCQSGYIEIFLEYYKLEKYFIDFECSGNTGKSKTENISDIMKRNNIKEAIYVGDTIKDQVAARNNNLKFIWAKYGFGICNDYDLELEDIKDLEEKMKRAN